MYDLLTVVGLLIVLAKVSVWLGNINARTELHKKLNNKIKRM